MILFPNWTVARRDDVVEVGRHLDALSLRCDVGAHRPQHQLGVVARAHGLDHRSGAFGEEPGQQQRGLDLRARHRHRVLDALQR